MCALCVSRCILIFCLTECDMQQPAICNAVLCLHTAPCNNYHHLARRGEGRGWGGGEEGWGREEGWGGRESTPLLFPITTPLTVHTGMMSSGKMVKYLVVMLIGLSAIN